MPRIYSLLDMLEVFSRNLSPATQAVDSDVMPERSTGILSPSDLNAWKAASSIGLGSAWLIGYFNRRVQLVTHPEQPVLGPIEGYMEYDQDGLEELNHLLSAYRPPLASHG